MKCHFCGKLQLTVSLYSDEAYLVPLVADSLITSEVIAALGPIEPWRVEVQRDPEVSKHPLQLVVDLTGCSWWSCDEAEWVVCNVLYRFDYRVVKFTRKSRPRCLRK